MREILRSQGHRRERSLRRDPRARPRAALPVSRHRRRARSSCSRTTRRSSTTRARGCRRCSGACRGRRCVVRARPGLQGGRRGARLLRSRRPSTARSPASSTRTCATPPSTRSSGCARSPITRRSRAIISRSRSRRSCRACRSSAAWCPSPPSSRAGRSTPRRLAAESGFHPTPFDRLGAAGGRGVPRGAAGRRHRHPRHALDARAGDRLHAGEHGARRLGSGGRGRALHRDARAGARLQDRPARDPRAAASARAASSAPRFDLREFHDVVLGQRRAAARRCSRATSTPGSRRSRGS